MLRTLKAHLALESLTLELKSLKCSIYTPIFIAYASFNTHPQVDVNLPVKVPPIAILYH